MSGHPTGCLSIWVDIEESDETDYVHWLTREHMPERMSVPGMLSARFLRSLARPRTHFMIVYETGSEDVLSSTPYLERLNNPSDWTRRIMPRLRHVVRSAAQLSASDGVGGTGGVVAAIRIDGEARALSDLVRCREILARAGACERVARAAAYETDDAATGIMTNEKRIRVADDAGFKHLVLVEGADERAVGSAQGMLNDALAGRQDVFLHTYALAHLLHHSIPEIRDRSEGGLHAER